MSTAYVVEWREVATHGSCTIPIPRGLPIRVQTVTFSGSSVATDEPLGDDCNLLELWTTHAAHVSAGSAPEATTDDWVISPGISAWLRPQRTGSVKMAFIEADGLAGGFEPPPADEESNLLLETGASRLLEGGGLLLLEGG